MLYIASLLTLLIGSFLNVIIYRLPLSMKNNLIQDYEIFIKKNIDYKKEKISIAFPSSHCTHCKTSIKYYDNIPILSYFILKGKCRHCNHKISLQYPVVELLSLLSGFTTFFFLGINITSIAIVILLLSLITLSFIDFKYKILPDAITISLVWLGLLIAFFEYGIVNFKESFISVIVFYVFIRVITDVTSFILSKDAMGYGDIKLIAAIAAFLGIENTLHVILYASIITVILYIPYKKMTNSTIIPFGPSLSIATAVVIYLLMLTKSIGVLI